MAIEQHEELYDQLLDKLKVIKGYSNANLEALDVLYANFTALATRVMRDSDAGALGVPRNSQRHRRLDRNIQYQLQRTQKLIVDMTRIKLHRSRGAQIRRMKRSAQNTVQKVENMLSDPEKAQKIFQAVVNLHALTPTPKAVSSDSRHFIGQNPSRHSISQNSISQNLNQGSRIQNSSRYPEGEEADREFDEDTVLRLFRSKYEPDAETQAEMATETAPAPPENIATALTDSFSAQVRALLENGEASSVESAILQVEAALREAEAKNEIEKSLGISAEESAEENSQD
jgi:hypothetical protein